MEIILLEDIRNLGTLGDQVNVRSGYGRNFLIPHGKAVPANKANILAFEERRAELEAKAKGELTTATTRAAKFEGLVLNMTAKAGEEGKLFGSIGVRDITEAVNAQIDVELEKSEISMPDGAIRALGEYDYAITLHSEVSTTIKVIVTAEEAPEE
ncbi:MAG: 50S ribosomal protein L9 [Gammaproteobacteria bacterium]|nr:50S ribosomal protein L9 [Gammaproteobacteria bacterium]